MEDLKKEHKEALYELNKANNELGKYRKKQYRLLFICLIIFAIVKCIMTGPFVIPLNIIPKTTHAYSVYVNGEEKNITYKETHIIKIIPYVVNISTSNKVEGNPVQNINFNKDKPINITVKVYDCYKGDKLVSCTNDKNIKKVENKSFKNSISAFTPNLANAYNYDDILIEDISKYLTTTDSYSIRIKSTYKNIKIENHFVIKIR